MASQPNAVSADDSILAQSKDPVRQDLLDAHRSGWARIASTGTWLTSARRLAVAGEIRHARDHCSFCRAIKTALSPNLPGTHATLGALAAPEIELVHRTVSDPGRLSEQWSQSVLDSGLTDGEYVEIVGIIAMVMMMDVCLSMRRMRSLRASATIRSPSGAMATPSGVSSCARVATPKSPENPVPCALSPTTVVMLLFGSMRLMTWLFESAK